MKGEKFAAAINDGSKNGMATSSPMTTFHIHCTVANSSFFTLNS
jgi:hypothetical protein